MKKIIIFDMDGTLLDTKIDISKTINYIRQELYSLEPLSIEDILPAFHLKNGTIAKYFYGTNEYEARARKLFEEHYSEGCVNNVKSFDGIDTLLEDLYFQNYSLNLLTNAPTNSSVKMMKHLKIDKFFDNMLGSTDVNNIKPEPDGIHKILDSYASIHSSIMVGDSHKDIVAAKNANIESILVDWENRFEEVEGKKPIREVSNLKSQIDKLSQIRV